MPFPTTPAPGRPTALVTAIGTQLRVNAYQLAALAYALVATRRRRRITLALAVLLTPVLAAVPAYADGGASNPWIGISGQKDTAGFTADQYGLSLDAGGVTNPGNAVGSFLAGLGWMIYRFCVGCVMWLLDWVLQFKQIDLLSSPANSLNQVVQSTVAQIGIAGAVGAVSLLISVGLFIRGRHGAGLLEMVSTTLLFTLIGTVIANPMGWVTGPSGALSQARDAGSAISTQIMTKDTEQQGVTDPDAARKLIEAQILDELVRKPHQLVNYGNILDNQGGGCVTAYNQSLTQPLADARNTVGDACGKAAADTSADAPSALLGVVVVSPGAYGFLALVFILAVVLLALTALVLWSAGKFLLDLVMSLFPGPVRSRAFIGLCTILVGCAFTALTIVALALLLIVLRQLFLATAGAPPAAIFIVLDLVIVVAAAALLTLVTKAHKHGKKLGETVAKPFSNRPGSLPAGGGLKSAVRDVVAPAAQLRSAHRSMRQSASGASPADAAGSGKRRNPLVKAAAGTAAAGKFGLKSTVGAPVYVPRAAAAGRRNLAAKKDELLTAATTRRDQAGAFKDEYVGNLATAGRFLIPTSGRKAATQLAENTKRMNQEPTETTAGKATPGKPATGKAKAAAVAKGGPKRVSTPTPARDAKPAAAAPGPTKRRPAKGSTATGATAAGSTRKPPTRSTGGARRSAPSTAPTRRRGTAPTTTGGKSAPAANRRNPPAPNTSGRPTPAATTPSAVGSGSRTPATMGNASPGVRTNRSSNRDRIRQRLDQARRPTG